MGKVLIFDYDGTIHNTIKIYEPAIRETCRWLIQEKHISIEKLSKAQIASWLGMNSRDMWNSFLPDLPEAWKEEASAMVGRSMAEQVRNHQAVWYLGIQDVLDELKDRGYTMVILSNCKKVYAKVHWEEFSMGRWFSAFYDCETYGFAPKTEIVKNIERKFPGPYAVIGDRYTDLKCAGACGGKFIGCMYGFGDEEEMKTADYRAEKPEDILKGIAALEI